MVLPIVEVMNVLSSDSMKHVFRKVHKYLRNFNFFYPFYRNPTSQMCHAEKEAQASSQ